MVHSEHGRHRRRGTCVGADSGADPPHLRAAPCCRKIGPRQHGIALGDAVALARALDQLPQRLLLYAVEVVNTDFGIGLSAEVAPVVRIVADEIADLLGTFLTSEDVT